MTHIFNALKIFLCFLLGLSYLASDAHTTRAADNPTIIRDTEIEAFFSEWSQPLLKANNIPPDGIKLVLVQSPQINAFVAGGANIFFYTGLLEKTENVGEIIGVFAHELGHVQGGHLIGTRGALEKASYESILGTILGIGAAIVSGDPQVANAVMSGVSSVATRKFLAYSRINENSADQSALTTLEKAKLNPSGLTSFMQKLESEELLPTNQQSEYMRTHPLTRDRINAVTAGAQNSPYKDKPFPPHWNEQHARMKAKLEAFTDPGKIPWIYDDSDKSISARYARTIAAYRQTHTKEALNGIDNLLKKEPDNPYFHELKGQMLVEFGRVAEALPSYQRAIDLKPDAGLIRISLGHVLMEIAKTPDDYNKAINELKLALRQEPRSTHVHRLLATAYGKIGKNAYAQLHLAEEALLQRRLEPARKLAEFAKKEFPEDSREHLEAQDILSYIDQIEKKK